MDTHRDSFRSVLDLLEEVRNASPESTALVSGEQRLTFDQLLNAAAGYASELTQRGVSENQTVALCLHRSFDWIAAALGIMQAGAAYVPLDLAWPAARLRFAIADSGARAVVASPRLASELDLHIPAVSPKNVREIAVAVEDWRSPNVSPESLAYVIYTSGSSGTPKGVEITHANLANLLEWYRREFNVACDDRASHLMGLGFDATVLEVWGHLCAGASLHLATEDVRSSAESIQSWMVEEQITIGVVPAVIGQPLIETIWPADSALRLLITGGDSLRRGPCVSVPFTVVNQYGPTECTVVSTFAVLNPMDEGMPPIGIPIPGSAIYLLDEEGEPVAAGTSGEIYIGGEGVGKGYRNLPSATEKCFLHDPFSSEPGARMYRSGDRAVRRTDGALEFRGRVDRQVKIRGHRVELDEIGTALMQHPSVAFGAATIRTIEGRDDAQLTGYILFSSSAVGIAPEELQKHLLEIVPRHMVPSLFVRLESLPLSANGKLDLNLLPSPDDDNTLRDHGLDEATNEIEDRLQAIVRDLLHNDEVRASDNFFLSGGHSLLGMQFLMQLREAFGIDLTLRELFEAPTVERLAIKVEKILMESIESMSDETAEAFLKE